MCQYIENLVSIVIPVHNAQATICQAIDSVLEQSYKNWELLVVNDCSTDNSVFIIEEYIKKDKRIKILHTDRSFGKPFYPRNLGVENARGQYIAFLDSDDIWYSKKLEKQLPLFRESKTALVFSNYEKFTSDTIEIRSNRQIIAPECITYRKALYGNQISNSTAIYDVSKIGKQYFMNVGHEDYVLWLQILKKEFIAKNTNTVEMRYRVSPLSVSSNKIHAAKWTWNIYRNVLHLNLFYSFYCYIQYMARGLLKYLK